MAYSSITKPEDYFNTKLYTGNGGAQSITGVGFQPDWVWLKRRDGSASHRLTDSVRGTLKRLSSDSNNAESTETGLVTSFDSDGFTLNSSDVAFNGSSSTYASWNWLAGGTAPAVTYSVKVVSDSGNKYRFDDFGTSAVTLDLQEGGTYTFDQSDSSNSGHPLRFSTTSDGSHGGGSEYTTGVTTTGTPGSAGAKTVITVGSSVATLYYYCTQHSGMGGQANTNSTFGSSNFSGSIQANVSANTDAGFSIVSYTATGSTATIGHGLGAVPNWILVKKRAGGTARDWAVYHSANTSAPETEILYLSNTDATADSSVYWNDTAPTSSVFTVGTGNEVNESSGNTYIAYCFAEKKGFSKFGSYTGNGNADGAFVYTGFKPAFIITKPSSTGGTYYNWGMWDTARSPSNVNNKILAANTSDDESNASNLGANQNIDFLSNGFKHRSADVVSNSNGVTYIYMAFAENPFVANDSGTAVPVTAR